MVVFASVCAAVAAIGLVWLFKPPPSILVPGFLIINDRVAQRLGFSSGDTKRLLEASDLPDARTWVRTRLLGLVLVTLAVTASLGHISIGVFIAEMGAAIYFFAIASVRSIEQTEYDPERHFDMQAPRFGDSSFVLPLLVVAGDALLLALLPKLEARLLALTVLAAVPVAYVIVRAKVRDGEEMRLRAAIDWRRKSSWVVTIVGIANVMAFAYSTLYSDLHVPLVMSLRLWALLGLAVTIYSTRHIFATSNDELRAALR